MSKRLLKYGGMVEAAFNWWLHEIHTALPKFLRRHWPRRAPLLIALKQNVLTFQRDGFEEKSIEFSGLNIVDTARQFLLRGENFAHLHIDLVIEECHVFRSRARCPKKADRHLRAMTLLDIERSMPFSADDVYFGAAVVARDGSFVEVEQVFAKRHIIDQILSVFESAKLTVNSIRPELSNAQVNLLSEATKKNLVIQRRWRVLRPVGFVVLSILFFTAAISARQEKAITTLKAQIEIAKTEAQSVRAGANVRAQTISAISEIRKRKKSEPSVLLVLKELTEQLGDETWLTELLLEERELRIAGFTDNAVSILTQLEQIALFEEVQFSSPVTLDQRQKKERFAIVLKIALPTNQIKTVLSVEGSVN